ncbi:MAG: MFS transporter [Candidatus Amoebophilus sp. 36-38]|nr:MAG: MFS transporter [Candidatus Amoebophilus sp. 36-38]
MWIFTHLDKELKQAIRLLSLGTFLEYFDLFLYAHMAVLLNDLFFPPADAHAQSLLTAFAFCSSFIFRPIGAMLFGYIGDTYGRKVTVVITTFMMAITCLIMANAPTYSQIGIAAAWIITACRILQGMSSMGEIVGAQLFLTEATPLPVRFPVVGLINVFADMGATLAIGIAALATSYEFNWRIAFWIGATVAIIGSLARTKLRETPEFADARKRLKNVADRTKENLTAIKERPFYNQPINPKTALAYFLMRCGGPTFLYFAFFYSASILKIKFDYSPHQILLHNLFLSVIQMFGWSVLRTYLSAKIHPLKILSFVCMITSIFIPFLPWLLNHIVAPWQLFVIQVFIVIIQPTDLPGLPIFFKNFPVFKRFSYASFLYAIAGAIVFSATSFGFTYLITWFGYWGLLILMVPVLIGYGYGLQHFIKLEKEAGRYPKLITWDMG